MSFCKLVLCTGMETSNNELSPALPLYKDEKPRQMSKCTGKNQQTVQGGNTKLTSCMPGIRVALLGQLLDLEHVWLRVIVPRDLRIPDLVNKFLVPLKSLREDCIPVVIVQEFCDCFCNVFGPNRMERECDPHPVSTSSFCVSRCFLCGLYSFLVTG